MAMATCVTTVSYTHLDVYKRQDGKDGVVGVELARQERRDLEPVELLSHGRDVLAQLLLVGLPFRGGRRLDQFLSLIHI